MRSTWFSRAARAALALAFAATVVGVTAAAAVPVPERPRTRRAMNLFAVTNAVLDVNRVFCGINNLGEICVDPTNSPVLGGGFWPKGTPNQYIFNSGLQIAGIIDPAAGFDWANDTTGAFFFDARGTQVQGDAVTLVFNSLDPNDAANWPNGAFVRDPAIYNQILIDRAAAGGISISQQDLWTRAWDGNPALISGRTHPMGILVEERGLAWNFPSGNEDIIYFIFTFYNISARSAAAYNNPTIHPDIRAEIAAVGASFQDRNEAAFNVQIPDGGYTITNLYAAFSMDPDVGDAGANYSTAILPFQMGVAYKSDFLEPTWSFPPEIFGPPFVPSPGFIGVKYLRSPTDALGNQVGLTMFSNTLNQPTGFPDPTGVTQLWRYLSGNVSPAAGDNPCTFQGSQLQRRYCFLSQEPADTRFYQASGPMTLPPGEARTIVVAYVHAAPTPAVVPFIDEDMQPGIPPSGAGLAAGSDTLRDVERGAGWLTAGTADTNGNGQIDQFEVASVPRSLLDKAIVAQAVFDNKFLLPFAPEPPTFFLVPGENQVTVTWQKSETETVKAGGGDPFFVVASDPTSPLYDPNFRQYDVEGYRIYRGRTPSQLELVAQFDYFGTTITDFTGGFAYTTDLDPPGPAGPNGIIACAPELGVTEDCPANFAGGGSVDHSLVGDVVQVPSGGRVLLANGNVLILQADTAVTGFTSGDFPPLEDSGVGFAFVDRGVRNSFRYFYAVTAFDINSLRSGPSSIESPRITKPVTPRKHATTVQPVVLAQQTELGDGTPFDGSAASWPSINADDGTFSGLIPPTNDGAMSIVAGIELLPAGAVAIRIDSVGPGFTGGIGVHPNIYLTLVAGPLTISKVVNLAEPGFSAGSSVQWDFGVAGEALVPYDSARARAFGLAFDKDTRIPISFAARTIPIRRTSGGTALAAGRFGAGNSATRYLAHSRWFDFGQPEPPDPTIRGLPDTAHHAGLLTGVGRIWAPQAYRDRDARNNATPSGSVNLFMRGFGYAQTAWYPADIVVTWNADSSITVRDSTHRSTLPFAPNGGSGWGFINLRAFAAAGVTTAEIEDGTGTPNVSAALGYHHLYGTQPTCYPDWWAITCIELENKAEFQPLDFDFDGAADADGIALMINGEAFIMEMDQIPAAGARWRLRAVYGAMGATCQDASGTFAADSLWTPLITDCSSYTFTPFATRPALVPGVTYRITVDRQYTVDSTAAGNLANVHTVPDPYYVTNSLEQTANTKVLKFVNLPPRAIIRIYSVSGILVQVVMHNDPAGGGEATWNLRNRNNQFVASGVYFYHVEAADGQKKVGRFTVVNFAQ